MSESDIQRDICTYLDTQNILFWRQNNAPIYDPTRQVFRKRGKWQAIGVSDIIIILPESVIFAEVKQPKAEQSPDQIAFSKAILDGTSFSYIVLTSIDDAIALVESIKKHGYSSDLRKSLYKTAVQEYKAYETQKNYTQKKVQRR